MVVAGKYVRIILSPNLVTFSCIGYSIKKYIPNGKVLAHLGFESKVLSGPLTDLNAWVGFCSSSPQQGVKYQL